MVVEGTLKLGGIDEPWKRRMTMLAAGVPVTLVSRSTTMMSTDLDHSHPRHIAPRNVPYCSILSASMSYLLFCSPQAYSISAQVTRLATPLEHSWITFIARKAGSRIENVTRFSSGLCLYSLFTHVTPGLCYPALTLYVASGIDHEIHQANNVSQPGRAKAYRCLMTLGHEMWYVKEQAETLLRRGRGLDRSQAPDWTFTREALRTRVLAHGAGIV
jgi:hypothetical protein